MNYGTGNAAKKRPTKFYIRLAAIAAAAIIVAIVIGACASTVPTGYTGIVTTFGRVEDYTFEAGFHLIAPWQKIVLMDNRIQKVSFSTLAFSSDIQQVDLAGSISYNIDRTTAMTLYGNVGTAYYDKLVEPRLWENAKTVVSKYTAEGLIENREKFSKEILTLMQTEMAAYGINIVSVSIENVDFTDAFTSAIEDKQVASQNKLRAETEQAQMTMEAEQKANRDRIEAEAAADVARIDADAKAYSTRVQAEAEAGANEKLAKSLTAELIDYITASNWDGALPKVSTDGAHTIIDTGSLLEGNE